MGKIFRWVAAITLLLGGLLSIVVPPEKSPDEAAHLVRAYLLLKGNIFLQTQPCVGENALCHRNRTMSGGFVDKGLLDYLERFNPNQRRKESELDVQSAKGVRWKNEEVFTHAPGTGYYFPLIYLPQAVALGIGKLSGLTVQQSYYLARTLVMVSGALVLTLAFYIFWPQPVVLALLLLPMSLFQMASASIDFLCNALAVLIMACFLRVVDLKDRSSAGLFWLMAISLFLLGSARAHLASMALLMLAGAFLSRKRAPWLAVSVTVVAILAWMAVSVPNTVDFRIAREATTGEVVAYYLSSPVQLFKVLFHTLSDRGLMGSYLYSFFGVFFDQVLSPHAYACQAVLLTLLTIFCLASPRQLSGNLMARAVLVVTGGAGAMLAMLAMLFTWSPHPASVVQGVQGRYFLVPVMLFLLGFCSWTPAVNEGWQRLRFFLLYALGSASLFISVHRLLQIYYIQPLVVTLNHDASDIGKLEPSPALFPRGRLTVHFPSSQDDSPASPVDVIGFHVATYGRTLQGTALLTLTDEQGRQHHIEINLDDVMDNSYLFSRVPPAHYRQAEFQIVDGPGGFSIWLSHPRIKEGEAPSGTSELLGCALMIREDRSMTLTPGCEAPR